MSLFSLRELVIENFRCFSHFEMELDARMSVLYAENACGKTSLLHALSVAMGGWFYYFNSYTKRNIHISDVRTNTRIVKESAERVEHYPVRVYSNGIVRGNQIAWAREIGSSGGSTTTKELYQLTNQAQALARAVPDHPDTSLPLLAFYGTQRLFKQHRATEAKQPKAAQPRFYGYIDSLNPASNEKQLLTWLFSEAMAEFQSGQRLPHVQALRSAVLRVTGEEFIDLFYDARLGEPCLVRKNGDALPWSRFSDGYHTFIGMVADMAWRAALLNPHLGEEAPAKVEGLVLIDEVDLHLHPRWQRRVLNDLCQAFPCLQFVVTTHSPQVLGSAKREWLRGIRANRSSPEIGAWVEGRDSNSILDDVMGAPSRDPQSTELIETLFEFIENGEKEPARRLLAELRSRLGPEDTLIVRAEARMHEDE